MSFRSYNYTFKKKFLFNIITFKTDKRKENFMSTITRQDLEMAYEISKVERKKIDSWREAIKYNNKNSVNTKGVTCFLKHSEFWEDISSPSGHNKFKNKITSVIIEYQAHDSNVIKPAQLISLRDQMQEHINHLFYKIFEKGPRNRDWKTLLDFKTLGLNYTVRE